MRISATTAILTLVLVAGLGWQQRHAVMEQSATDASHAPVAAHAPTANHTSALPAFLPPEAHATIHLIQRGGPFPHRQDGNVFGNFEKRLPQQPRGWYHEYTVDTPGLNHRGARRIVTGGNPPRDWYYSNDHYRSFRQFDVPKATP